MISDAVLETVKLDITRVARGVYDITTPRGIELKISYSEMNRQWNVGNDTEFWATESSYKEAKLTCAAMDLENSDEQIEEMLEAQRQQVEHAAEMNRRGYA